MTKVHIVNHTHWDREWYFTSADSLVLSEQLFTDVLAELEEQPEASFVLDGQLSILDDYVGLYPEKLALIKRLIADEQLFIGPWFTQTDAFFASGESILRNLMIGIYESRKYGPYMPIGYLPDTFGFNAQMPLLLSEAGFDNIVFWRGLHLGKHVALPYFNWQALGGSQVVAINLPQGYGTGMLLEATSQFVEGRLDPAVEFILQYGKQEEVLIPSGNDQLNIITDFKDKVAKINQIGKFEYQMSTYQEFLNYVKGLSLETYQGEFREPVLARVHKTIGSSRMAIKLKTAQIEEAMVKRLEPLLVIARRCGVKISHQLVINVWKKLLEGQAHDSLAGCVSDAVAADIMHRLKEATEMIASLENTITKKIADQLELSPQEVLVFNTDPHTYQGIKTIEILSPTKEISFTCDPNALILKSEYVEPRQEIMEETPAGNRFITEAGYYRLRIQLRVKLPALGYQVISFQEGPALLELKVQDQTTITNERYRISFENQQLVLYTDGERIENVVSLWDQGNDGDTYDYSPIQGESPLELRLTESQVVAGPGYQKLIVKGTTILPLNLSERSNQLATGELAVTIALSLREGADDSHGLVTVDNQIASHRLRLKIKTGTVNQEAMASLPFGFIKRENQLIENWQETYSEQPVNVEPLETTVSINGTNRSCSVFTRGMKEYEYDKEALYITLLATTGQLGKPNLLYRPGRASGDTTKKGHVAIATPEAELIGNWEFPFILRFDQGKADEQVIASWRYQLQQVSISYQRQQLNHFINRLDNKIQRGRRPLKEIGRELSVLSLPADLLVSSCYSSYYLEKTVIVRIENPTADKVSLNKDDFEDYQPVVINVLEEPKEQQVFVIPAYSFISLQLTPKYE